MLLVILMNGPATGSVGLYNRPIFKTIKQARYVSVAATLTLARMCLLLQHAHVQLLLPAMHKIKYLKTDNELN